MLGDDASFRLLLVESTDEDIARHLDSIERALIEFVDPLIDADLEPEHRKLLAAAVVGTAKSAAEFWFDEHGTAPDPATRDRDGRPARLEVRPARVGRAAQRRAELSYPSAAARSAARSSIDSIPTESRTRSVGDLERGALDGLVRHLLRVLDQRLHAAERLAQGEEPGAVADLDGRLAAARHPEADHAAEAAHLARGDGVARGAPRGPGRGPR